MTEDRAGLVISQVRFGYRDAAVLQSVSGRVEPGRVTVLLGPNASGKSTLVGVMLGQLEPWDGTVMLDGEAVGSMDAGRRAAKLAYVPQRSAVQFAFTVRQVVAMGRFALRRDDAAIERAMARCDVMELRDRPYVELSVGQQQRVLLARAMAQCDGGGRMLLLDEPTSAMDLQHVLSTMHLLRTLAGEGLGVFVVLHDPNLAARFADAVWLMDGGRIVEEGPWRSVLDSDTLGRLYQVAMRELARDSDGRPVFQAQRRDTL